MTEPNTERKNIAIIGAGITGLSAAYYLQQAGHSAVIFEKSDRLGGAIQTSIKEGFLCEHGPNSLMVNNKRVSDLIENVGLSSRKILANKAANKRFIVHDQKLSPLPHSPLSFLTTPLFSFSAKCKLLKEPFIAKRSAEGGEESFTDFIRRRLGSEILEKAAGPFVSGIYAGDPNRLSTRYAFPKLFQLEQQYGSLFKGAFRSRKENKKNNPHYLNRREIISFTEGMEELPKGIASHLEDGTLFYETTLGGISLNKQTQRWHLDWKCSNGSIGQGSFTDVIITTPAHQLENLPLPEELFEQITKLPHLEYPPVASMLLGFKRSQIKHPLDGFGMLNSLNEKSKILGSLFTSTLFEGRAPDDHVAINVMLGGAKTPEHGSMTESAMKASVMDELRRLLGIEGNPVFTHLVKWEKAIPQLNIGYGAALEQMKHCENQWKGLHFAGNYRGGISVGDCILSGIKLCAKISQH